MDIYYAWICLLLQLIHTQKTSTQEVTSFTLDIEDAWACQRDNIETDVDSFTTCTYVRPRRDPLPQALLYTLETTKLLFVVRIKKSSIVVQLDESSHEFHVPLLPDRWSQICFIKEKDKVRAWVHGREIKAEIKYRFYNQEERTTNNSRFCIGKDDEIEGTAFRCDLANMFFIKRSISLNELMLFQHCKHQSDVDSWINLDQEWTDTKDVILKTERQQKLCFDQRMIYVITKPGNYMQHSELCHKLSGIFLTMESIASDLQPNPRLDLCAENGKTITWLQRNTRLSYDLEDECPVLKINNEISSHPCLDILPCSICRVQTAMIFYLYGLGWTFDNLYFLNVDAGKLHIEGSKSSHIRFSEDEWVLESRIHKDVWRLRNQTSPTGRLKWYSPVTKEERYLTLTYCSIEQFYCTNGKCINDSLRCNGIDDCSDNSDEESCNTISTAKTSDQNQAARPRFNESKLQISCNLDLKSIDNIRIEAKSVSIQHKIELEWFDNRLVFWNPKQSGYTSDCSNIWTPIILYYNGFEKGREIESLNVNNKCNVQLRDQKKDKKNFMNSYQDRYMEGDEVPVRMTKESLLQVPCDLKLYYYPFGSYICQIDIVLDTRNQNYQYDFTAIGSDLLAYDENKSLGDFKFVGGMRKVNADRNITTIFIELKVKSGFHVLTTFMPSIFIFLISYSCLYIPNEEFNERLIASFMSLLSVIGFFIQASLSSVKTTYLKLLDVWYALIIILCCLNVLIIITLHFMKSMPCLTRNKVFQKLEDKEAEMLKENEILIKIWRLNKLARILSPLLFLIFIFVFILLVNV